MQSDIDAHERVREDRVQHRAQLPGGAAREGERQPVEPAADGLLWSLALTSSATANPPAISEGSTVVHFKF